MEHSESLKELAAALAKAQAEIENAHKTSDNPFFRSKYADLAEIINTSRPVLTKHGLSVVQMPGFDGQNVSVETILLHSSGEWLAGLSGAPMPQMTTRDGRELPPSPQSVGSAITYLRRYSLAAVCNIAQDDDDAETASGRQSDRPVVASSPRPAGQNPSAPAHAAGDVPPCPKCRGKVWDNRLDKKNPKAPDFKCRDKACDGAVWLEAKKPAPVTVPDDSDGPPDWHSAPPPDDPDLPF